MAKGSPKKAEANGSALDFEAALGRLEDIVEQLDSGNLPLAQSLALFKEGTALAKRCRDLLTDAEVAVKEALTEVKNDGAEQFDASRPQEDGA